MRAWLSILAALALGIACGPGETPHDAGLPRPVEEPPQNDGVPRALGSSCVDRCVAGAACVNSVAPRTELYGCLLPPDTRVCRPLCEADEDCRASERCSLSRATEHEARVCQPAFPLRVGFDASFVDGWWGDWRSAQREASEAWTARVETVIYGRPVTLRGVPRASSSTGAFGGAWLQLEDESSAGVWSVTVEVPLSTACGAAWWEREWPDTRGVIHMIHSLPPSPTLPTMPTRTCTLSGTYRGRFQLRTCDFDQATGVTRASGELEASWAPGHPLD